MCGHRSQRLGLFDCLRLQGYSGNSQGILFGSLGAWFGVGIDEHDVHGILLQFFNWNGEGDGILIFCVFDFFAINLYSEPQCARLAIYFIDFIERKRKKVGGSKAALRF